MQLPMTRGSQTSSESETNIKMTLGSPSSPPRQRGPFTLSSAMVDPLTNFDTWPTTTGTNSKKIMDHFRPGVGAGRGRLPSIEEMHPVSKLTFPAQETVVRMFTTPGDNANVYAKRRNPQAGQPSHLQGHRPVRDRIIKHSLSESHLRARVEPISDDSTSHQPLFGNGLLEGTGVWTSPAGMSNGLRQSRTVVSRSPPSNLTAQRETITIDGKTRRVRFLSADHTPLKEDPEFKKLFFNKNVTDVNRNVISEQNTRTKPGEDKKIHLRSVTVSGGRKASLEGGGKATPKTDEKKETPDVWLERARKLRASKDKSNNNVTKAESTSRQSESIKFHEDEPEVSDKVEEKLASTIKHVNYCDEKKTQWVVKWLEEVNKQTHFEFIE